MYICQIGAKQAGQRLDKLVFSICPDLPGSAFYRALKRGNIKINGRRREISYRVQAGDTLRLYLEPQYLPGAAESGGVPAPVPAGPTFAVVYEDDHVLLADKPAGLLVLPGQNGEQNNLQNQLRHYLQEQGGSTAAPAASCWRPKRPPPNRSCCCAYGSGRSTRAICALWWGTCRQRAANLTTTCLKTPARAGYMCAKTRSPAPNGPLPIGRYCKKRPS